MYNFYLKFLLSNEPKKVISKTGYYLRKVNYKLFRNVLKKACLNQYKSTINNSIISEHKKNIIACTHEFHDDITYALLTINETAYVLYGNVDSLLKSAEGIGLWLNGVIAVNRFISPSRKASLNKIDYALDNNIPVLGFFEATYNREPNMPVMELFPGFYYAALKNKKKNAEDVYVTPMALMENGIITDKNIGEAYDPTIFTEENYQEMFIYLYKYLLKSYDLLTACTSYKDDSNICYLADKLKNIIDLIDFESYLYILKDELPEHIFMIQDYINKLISYIFEVKNCYSDNNFNLNVLNEVNYNFSNIVKIDAIVATKILREKLATLKYNLYPFALRSNVSKQEWNEYVLRQVNGTNGFYDEILEKQAKYNDPSVGDTVKIYKKVNERFKDV